VAQPSGDTSWWRYAVAKFNKGELDLAEQRALSRASGAGGNFLVPTDMAELIVEAARAESSIARLANEFVTDTGASLSIPTAPFGGTASWVAENALVTPSDPSLGEVLLAAHKSATRVIVSEELARDARVRFDEYLANEIGRRLGVVQGQGFAAGSGTGQPLGLAGNVAAVTAATGSATSYKLVDLASVYRALPAPYRAKATWLIHPDTYASLASLTDSAGGLVLPALQGPSPSLLGRPVELEAYLAAPAAGARSLVFADVKQAYAVRRVSGVSVQRLEEVYSDNGQLGFRARERVDGRVVLADAARALAHSAT
jgi:HK97 family phage major capsid protein